MTWTRHGSVPGELNVIPVVMINDEDVGKTVARRVQGPASGPGATYFVLLSGGWTSQGTA